MALRGLRRVGRPLWIPVLAAGLLAACGGGSSQIEAFLPDRLIVLGDDTSVLVNDGTNNGKKYGVNGLDETNARDCLLLPTWTQSLASFYGFVFAECNKNGDTPKAFMRARVGAKVDDPTLGVAQQLADQVAAGGPLTPKDLVTVMMGTNDLIELNDRVLAGTMTAGDALAEVRRRGQHMAERVNQILATGAKAIVSTMPDIGLSPYARVLDATSAGTSARLSSWTFEFNANLRTTIDSTKYDGRNYGLVIADDIVQAMARNPSSFGLGNVTDAACKVAQPDCTGTADDLVDTTAGATYLWASDRHLAPPAQAQIGSSATSRARNNPF